MRVAHWSKYKINVEKWLVIIHDEDDADNDDYNGG